MENAAGNARPCASWRPRIRRFVLDLFAFDAIVAP
jgi:hypothetical protein